MFGLCFCCVDDILGCVDDILGCIDDILGCIGVSMPSFDNFDHVACVNSWSLRIHYYGIVGIMFVFKMFVCDISGLIVLFKDAWFNE